MVTFFIKGFFWGSMLFLSWNITLVLGLFLALFMRYWGVFIGFFIVDILFYTDNDNLFPRFTFSILALIFIFLGKFIEKYIWTNKESY